MKIFERFPNYGFTEDGRVFNLKFNRELKPYISNTTGYLYVTLKHEDEVRRPTALHRIVAILFIPNPENLPQVNHKDCDKLNCCADNLEWIDNRGNIQHAYDNGTIPKQDKRYNNIHPSQSIHSVCELLSEGILNMKEIGLQTNVAHDTVKEIKYRKQWKDISKLYKW